jgi:ubiquinone/menaquinone biosynthesis C-methylase UbiE
MSENRTDVADSTHFDAGVHAYERWGQPQTEMFSRAALDTAALPEGAAVLDVCAGMGALAVAAAERGHRGRAIDTSPGMIRRATERLSRYPEWSAELMDALDLQYGANQFDAAFSVCGVVYFGPKAGQALAEMLRVVRPGGLIGVVNFSDAYGGPFFLPVGRAIDRLNDLQVGRFVPPLTDYLSRPDLEQLLIDAGCAEVRSEAVEGVFDIPDAESFVAELEPIIGNLPQYRTAMAKHSNHFRGLLEEEVRRTASKPLPPARGIIAYGRVPAV